jgi:hypothetical protein
MEYRLRTGCRPKERDNGTDDLCPKVKQNDHQLEADMRGMDVILECLRESTGRSQTLLGE